MAQKPHSGPLRGSVCGFVSGKLSSLSFKADYLLLPHSDEVQDSLGQGQEEE